MTDTRTDRAIAALDRVVTTYPGVIVVAFLIGTAIMASGAGAIESQAGADQFASDVPAQQALEDIEEDFEGGIGSDETSAQLFFRADNVLDRSVLVRILETQHRLETHGTARVQSTSTHATTIATTIDPTAETPEEQRRAIEEATDRDLNEAIDQVSDQLSGQLSTDYNPSARSAAVSLGTITYDVPPSADTDRIASLQRQSVGIVDSVAGNEAGENVLLFGDGILQQEVNTLLGDTAIVVFPAAVGLILIFLLIAYRDPVDMLLGLVSIGVTAVWTFGFMGYAGIPFSDSIISVIPLLLAVGIDFGIHIINRYREERAKGFAIAESMRITTDQLLIAFLLVVITTVFSFAANLVSDLEATQEFGIVAAFGMIAVFLSFGVFLPAAKVLADRGRAAIRFPSFGETPLGSDDSTLATVLSVGVTFARLSPQIVVIGLLLVAAVAGAYGTGVDTEFSEEAFFPSQDRIDLYELLPEPFAPSEYTFIEILSVLEDDFDQGFVDSVTLYIDQSVRDDDALELIDRTVRNPPETFETDDRGRAAATSVVTVLQDQASVDPAFEATVDRNDRLGNQVPDRNVDEIYDELLESPRGDTARAYLAADRGSARIDFQIESDADPSVAVAETRALAERTPLTAVPTGQLVVNEAVIDVLTESAIQSLILAFILTAIVLTVSYRLLEGRLAYGVINLIPVLATVGLLVGTMRAADIPLSPITAPILSISIGLGVDYTVHFTHRFVDEFEERRIETSEQGRTGTAVLAALSVTLSGTGGALTGSMLTTVTGIGVLYVALIPLIQDFGVLLALGVFYAYLMSVLLVPSVVVLWDRYVGL